MREGPVSLPRRLVYVVDRRTVVDQATDVAMDLRERLADPALKEVCAGLLELSTDEEKPLSISTLRGEYADNGEWREDPARAAIIIGTVDMIGSRLLFSGYGVSRRMRPVHAGFLGQDTLIVHDEAHLSPAFGSLIKEIRRLQKDAREVRPIRVMELSATRRGEGAAEVFTIAADDWANCTVKRRLRAAKRVHLRSPGDAPGTIDAIAREAASYKDAKVRVVVYVRSPKTAGLVVKALTDPKTHRIEPNRIALLTGTIRGYERDQMTLVPWDAIPEGQARDRARVFQGFRANPGRPPPDTTEYLVATSAGEVGVDLDADHMVSDLTTLDSMIQRLGRVNRLGGRTDTTVTVFDIREKDEEAPDDQDQRLDATRRALGSLDRIGDGGGFDASPDALRRLVETLGPNVIADAFSKRPDIPGLTDILLDGWAMTSVDDLPGRPAVDRWLHGRDGQQPSLYVAWREEVGHLDKVYVSDLPDLLKTIFGKHPVRAQERVGGPLSDVVEELKKVARRSDGLAVVLLPRGAPRALLLSDVLKDPASLKEATIVLAPAAGGKDDEGMIAGGDVKTVRDVADLPSPGKRKNDEAPVVQRVRVLLTRDGETDTWRARRLGGDDGPDGVGLEATGFKGAVREARTKRGLGLDLMRETGRAVLAWDSDGDESRALLLFALRGTPEAAEGSQDALRDPVTITDHNAAVGEQARSTVRRLHLTQSFPLIADAVELAAARHDLGKDRDGWQKAIGHRPPKPRPDAWTPWAKSDRQGFDDSECGKYRHEFGSLREAAKDAVITVHPERELILHLIATHHGWGRPHFAEEQWDIADDLAYGENEAVAANVLWRYAELQRRLGRWQLAWLEALVRAADIEVSARAPAAPGSGAAA